MVSFYHCLRLAFIVAFTTVCHSSADVSRRRSILGCFGAKRCGLLSVTMHRNNQETNQCKESCVILPLFKRGLSCGECPVPTPTSPTSTASNAPIQSPATPTAPTSLVKKDPTNRPVAPPSPSTPSTPTAPSEFNIQLQLVGIPSSDATLFSNAKARWESVITGDLSDLPKDGLPSVGAGCEFPSVIDDLYICASYKSIDGPKKVVGLAGPYFVRGKEFTSSVGVMEFDSADIEFLKSAGSFVDTVLHEMGHVLGLGVNWDDSGVAGPASNKCPYTGTNANREYQAVSGCSAVPTEQDASLGACGHWSEKCLVDELMTGMLVAGSKASLSRITVGSLQDLGYQVDYSKADNYTRANLGPQCTCNGSGTRRERSMLEMSHGETIQLGRLRGSSSGPQRSHRRLSDEAHESAVTYGRSVLAQRGAQDHPADHRQLSHGMTFVGNKVVSVLVREEGEVYGVVVRA